MATISIPYKYTPRFYQVPLLESVGVKGKYKNAVAVWHRRAGKDKTLFNLIVRESFKRVGSYYYFYPFLKQGKMAIWRGMDKAGFPFLGHVPVEAIIKKNDTDMMIELKNGSIIQIAGTDNYNNLMSTNPVGCVFSEYSLQDPMAYKYIKPILLENDGWACFNFTPRGRNHGWDIYNTAKNNPDTWFSEILTIEDTGVLTKEDMNRERKEGISEEHIAQEYYCSFSGSQEGAYYAQQLRVIREEGRICKVPVQSGIPVDTYWDLGMDDSTSIWFVQNCGREIHLIEYFEDRGEGLPYYAQVLREKGYFYGEHVFPNDILVRELGTGMSRLRVARQLFGTNVSAANKPGSKEDAIEAVRNMLKICWFDEDKCSHGIDALASFRKEWDEERKLFKPKPVHDWAIHAADAIQTMALGHKMYRGHRRGSIEVKRVPSMGWT